MGRDANSRSCVWKCRVGVGGLEVKKTCTDDYTAAFLDFFLAVGASGFVAAFVAANGLGDMSINNWLN